MCVNELGFFSGFMTLPIAVLFGIVFIWMGMTTDKLKEISRHLKGEPPKKPGH